MRIKILLPSILILLFANITLSQDWLSQDWAFKLIQSKGINGLEKEMEKFLGTKVQNISFRPVKDTSNSANFDQYKGKVLIIQLATTNCSGCKMQAPELSRIEDLYAGQGVEVIYLFFAAKDFLKRHYNDHNYSGIIAYLEEQRLSKPFQTIAFPTAYIIDSNGIIKDCWVVPKTFHEIEKRLKKVLAVNKQKAG